jgi:small subunit ribosomal protein S5
MAREFSREEGSGLEEKVVKIYRCATVVKGGRRFSFAALVVVGDGAGQVALGYGKANEVPSAVEKGLKIARKELKRVPLVGTTIPHQVKGHQGASKVVLIPAAEGTGVIAGAAVRAVCMAAGIKDVLTKAYGSVNHKNLCKATLNALLSLRDAKSVAQLRGVKVKTRFEAATA